MPLLDNASLDNATLDNATERQIKQLCAEGYQHYDEQDFKSALRLFYQAWLKVPKPQMQWDQAGWVLTAIGDTYFRLAQYNQGREALLSALHCKGIDNNPFVHMRLGQCLLELGDIGSARRELLEAYKGAGRDIFLKQAAKYLSAIEDLVGD